MGQLNASAVLRILEWICGVATVFHISYILSFIYLPLLNPSARVVVVLVLAVCTRDSFKALTVYECFLRIVYAWPRIASCVGVSLYAPWCEGNAIPIGMALKNFSGNLRGKEVSMVILHLRVGACPVIIVLLSRLCLVILVSLIFLLGGYHRFFRSEKLSQMSALCVNIILKLRDCFAVHFLATTAL